jgi:hypothetical protein
MTAENLTIRTLYRETRATGAGARTALYWARRLEQVAHRAARVGLQLKESAANSDDLLIAEWSENGYDLRATLVVDPNGWWDQGIADIGHFVGRQEPGAIRHHAAGPHEMEWFVPVPWKTGRERHAALKAALGYGRSWQYASFEVTASRAGVELGCACEDGFTTDQDLAELHEAVFALADQAMEMAEDALLCLCTATRKAHRDA